MFNPELLKQEIKGSGFRMGFIADQLGMSHKALNNRMRGRTPWKATEAEDISNLLGLTNKRKKDIFFA